MCNIHHLLHLIVTGNKSEPFSREVLVLRAHSNMMEAQSRAFKSLNNVFVNSLNYIFKVSLQRIFNLIYNTRSYIVIQVVCLDGLKAVIVQEGYILRIHMECFFKDLLVSNLPILLSSFCVKITDFYTHPPSAAMYETNLLWLVTVLLYWIMQRFTMAAINRPKTKAKCTHCLDFGSGVCVSIQPHTDQSHSFIHEADSIFIHRVSPYLPYHYGKGCHFLLCSILIDVCGMTKILLCMKIEYTYVLIKITWKMKKVYNLINPNRKNTLSTSRNNDRTSENEDLHSRLVCLLWETWIGIHTNTTACTTTGYEPGIPAMLKRSHQKNHPKISFWINKNSSPPTLVLLLPCTLNCQSNTSMCSTSASSPFRGRSPGNSHLILCTKVPLFTSQGNVYMLPFFFFGVQRVPFLPRKAMCTCCLFFFWCRLDQGENDDQHYMIIKDLETGSQNQDDLEFQSKQSDLADNVQREESEDGVKRSKQLSPPAHLNSTSTTTVSVICRGGLEICYQKNIHIFVIQPAIQTPAVSMCRCFGTVTVHQSLVEPLWEKGTPKALLTFLHVKCRQLSKFFLQCKATHIDSFFPTGCSQLSPPYDIVQQPESQATISSIHYHDVSSDPGHDGGGLDNIGHNDGNLDGEDGGPNDWDSSADNGLNVIDYADQPTTKLPSLINLHTLLFFTSPPVPLIVLVFPSHCQFSLLSVIIWDTWLCSAVAQPAAEDPPGLVVERNPYQYTTADTTPQTCTAKMKSVTLLSQFEIQAYPSQMVLKTQPDWFGSRGLVGIPDALSGFFFFLLQVNWAKEESELGLFSYNEESNVHFLFLFLFYCVVGRKREDEVEKTGLYLCVILEGERRDKRPEIRVEFLFFSGQIIDHSGAETKGSGDQSSAAAAATRVCSSRRPPLEGLIPSCQSSHPSLFKKKKRKNSSSLSVRKCFRIGCIYVTGKLAGLTSLRRRELSVSSVRLCCKLLVLHCASLTLPHPPNSAVLFDVQELRRKGSTRERTQKMTKKVKSKMIISVTTSEEMRRGRTNSEEMRIREGEQK
ncbi:hypothetical protein VP01_1348g1 [Puccinia sorghi]|uniref:Uncharacterized protein n=1 Tax=Puccinia sorghi TaxID=27349 RepID=A0A0L6VM91_9BASI|nr:hypothetical protein VP01_1348g1 [Puccinia sorghi]